MSADKIHFQGCGRKLCGNGWGVYRHTENRRRVTCKRCRQALAPAPKTESER